MIVRKEGDAELVWRKLYDEGYFVYTMWTHYIYSTQFCTAVLYPKYRIREYCGETAINTYHSEKYLARKYSYSPLGAVVSSDGKLWRRISGNDRESAVIPKGDGIVVCSTIGSSKREYTYYPILKSGYPDEENALVIYSEADAGTRLKNSIINFSGITNFCLMLDQSNSPYKAFAVDLKGNIYDGLFTTYYSEIGGSGCYNGMYYCVFNNIPDGGYVYVSRSIDGAWERRELPLKARNIYTIQSSNGIVVYLNMVNNSFYGAVHVYTTTDFVNYTKVEIPTSLSVPIISPVYEVGKSYVNYIMAYGQQDMKNAYNEGLYINMHGCLGDMSQNRICYIEKGKISPLNGMIIQHEITLIDMQKKQITVYLDNLFFQPSEGNFAFFEELYPEEYMNDYLEKHKEN